MNNVKCFDVAEMVLEEATKRFSPQFSEDAERKDILKEYCDAIDGLVKEFNAESFEVSVDEIKMTVFVDIDFPDIVIRTVKHPFYDLIERSVSVKFSHGDGDTVAVRFEFPSIWKKNM